MPFVVSTDLQELANRITHHNLPVEVRVHAAHTTDPDLESWSKEKGPQPFPPPSGCV